MKYKPLPSLEIINERYVYDPLTGVFSHKKAGAKFGKPAGGKDKTGISLYFGEHGRFKAHRIAYFLQTGEDPVDALIDHKDQNPFNNEWLNLRKANSEENGWNSSRANGQSGVKGITIENGKFKARIRVGSGKRINLGRFDTIEEASEALRVAREVYHGEFANSI